jgi:hypothetical protein
VALEAELAEGRVEKEVPLAVVPLVHVKGDRDMVADGDPLDLTSGGGSDGEAVVGGSVRVIGGGRHGSRRCDEGILKNRGL